MEAESGPLRYWLFYGCRVLLNITSMYCRSEELVVP
jgi:hypothetical protein